MGEAIERTSRLYPGLLENDHNLMFMLKCRQFVEMINGSDVEICHRKSIGGYSPSFSISSRPNSPIQTSVIQSTKSYSNNKSKQQCIEELNQNNAVHNGNSCVNNDMSVINAAVEGGGAEESMEVESDDIQNGHHSDSCNGKTNSSNGYQNGTNHGSNNSTQDPCCGDNPEEEMGKELYCFRYAFRQLLSVSIVYR